MAHDGNAAPAKTFRWEDPFDMDGRLTDDEGMIRDAARAYAREQLLPRIVEAFRDETFDRAIMTEMGEMGFLGACCRSSTAARGPVTSPMA